MPLNLLKPTLLLLCVPLIMGASLSDGFRITPTQLKENLWKHSIQKIGALTDPLLRKSTLGDFGINPDIMPVGYDYYDINGQDRDTLIRQLAQLFPGDKKTLGLTEWGVEWEVQFNYNQDNICTQFNVQVTGFITFLMPRWTGYTQGSPALKKKWDTMYEALQRHEDGHALHGVKALKEVQRLKPRLSRTATCRSIADNFYRRASKILQKYKQKDIDYDRETRHGITQGTIF
jgi:predicted secreted Zn-dependent protease